MKKLLAGLTLSAVLFASFGNAFAGSKNTSFFSGIIGGTEHAGVMLTGASVSDKKNGMSVTAYSYKPITHKLCGSKSAVNGSKNYKANQEFYVNYYNILASFGYHSCSCYYSDADGKTTSKTYSGYDYN